MLQAAANCAGTQLQLLPGNYTGKETGYGFFLFPDVHNAWKHQNLQGRHENFAGNWGLGRWLWVYLGFFNGATSPEAWPKTSQQRLAEPPGSSGSWIPIKNIPGIEAFPRWSPESHSSSFWWFLNHSQHLTKLPWAVCGNTAWEKFCWAKLDLLHWTKCGRERWNAEFVGWTTRTFCRN